MKTCSFMMVCFAMMLNSRAVSENEKLIAFCPIPLSVFQVATDAFKQVVSKNIPCGKVSAGIVTVTPQPAPEADAGFSFVSTANKLSIEIVGVKKGKVIQAGGFTWNGDSLSWAWQSFAEGEVGDGVKRLRKYFESAAFVVTLEGGGKVLLAPQPIEWTLHAKPDADGLLVGTTVGAGIPDGLALEVESMSVEPCRSNARGLGKINAVVNGTEIDMELAHGECTMSESGFVSRECKAKERELVENNKLLKTLTGKQRELLEVETNALKDSIASLRLQMKTGSKVSLNTKLVVRAVNPKSMRPYAFITIELKR